MASFVGESTAAVDAKAEPEEAAAAWAELCDPEIGDIPAEPVEEVICIAYLGGLNLEVTTVLGGGVDHMQIVASF